MRDLAVSIAEDLHVADGARAAIDHSLGQQVHEEEEDEDGEADHHPDQVAHHADKLVAHGAHVVGRGVAGEVARVEVELLVAYVTVEVRGIVAEELVEVVDAHVDVHVRLGAPGGIVARILEGIVLVLVLVMEADLLSLPPAELVEKAAAKDDAPVANVQALPVARVRGDAVDGYGLHSVALAAIILQLVDGVLLGLGDLLGTVVRGVDGVDVVVVRVDVGSIVDKVDDFVAVAAEGVRDVVEARVEGVLLVLRLLERVAGCLHARGTGRRHGRLGRLLGRVRRIVELVFRILGGGEQRAVDGLQAVEGGPLLALLGCALELEWGLERVLVRCHEARLEVVCVVRHRGKDRQAKEQKQRGERDAHEERGEVTEVAQEDAQAEARDEAHALREAQAALGAGLAAGLMAQELQGRLAHLAEKPRERDEDERGGRYHGAFDENLPAPKDVEGRQAVGAVVETAHGLGEDAHAERGTQKRGEDANNGGKREVVEDNLALAIAAREQRSDDGALLLDGGVGEHDEDEGHDHDDDVEQRRPHHGVAVHVVARVADALVGIRVDEVVHARIGVHEGIDHVLLGIGSVCDGEAAIVEDKRVGVGGRAACVFERGKAGVGDLGHAIGDGVDREVRVVEEERLAVGLGHDAADGVGAPFELDRIAHGEAVVRGEDAVDGDLVVCLRFRTLAVGREVNLGAVGVGAQRALGAVVTRRLLDGGVYREVLVERDASYALRGVLGCLSLGVGRLEGGRHAAVLDCVLVAHAVDEAADGVRGEKKARREGNRAAHEQEYAEVLAKVVLELSGESPCQGSHRAPTNRARRRSRGRR